MEGKTSTQSAGLMFSKFMLLVLLAGFLLAAWYGLVILATLLGLALAAAALTRLWSRFSLVGVSCQRVLSEQRVFPGDYIELKLQLSNRKLLPLPWIQVDDEIPVGFAPDIISTPENRLGFGFLSRTAALLWYSKVNWKSRLFCSRRGYYQLGPVRISSGDIFGFYPRSVTQSLLDHIIVYPKLLPIEQVAIPSLFPWGNARTDRRIFEDPTRIMGIRDYKPHDSLKRIHWKATARRQSLQVKVFEQTTTLDVIIFLAIDSFNQDRSYDDDFEHGISMAASLAKYIAEKGYPTGLFVNSRLADSGQPATILPGSSPQQLVLLLEALAKVTRTRSISFEEFLNQQRGSLPWGTSLIFIVHKVSDSFNIMFTNLKEAGYKLIVHEVGIPVTQVNDTVRPEVMVPQ
jgi:uncharacterized protein (DUF58 family)